MNYLRNRKNAILNGISGLAQAFKNEVHLKLFLFIAFLVIILAAYFRVSKFEWVALLLCICMVLSLELFNSAIEKLCDKVMPQINPKIKYIKDVMAGSVLLACIFAACVGLIIFSNYI